MAGSRRSASARSRWASAAAVAGAERGQAGGVLERGVAGAALEEAPPLDEGVGVAPPGGQEPGPVQAQRRRVVNRGQTGLRRGLDGRVVAQEEREPRQPELDLGVEPEAQAAQEPLAVRGALDLDPPRGVEDGRRGQRGLPRGADRVAALVARGPGAPVEELDRGGPPPWRRATGRRRRGGAARRA